MPKGKLAKGNKKKIVTTNDKGEEVVQIIELSDAHRRFCEEYVIDWNASRAYSVAYNNKNMPSCGLMGHQLLKNIKIQLYISEIQKDMSKLSGISALMVIKELARIAFANISDYKSDWNKLVDWDSLTTEQKAAISSITEIENVYGQGKNQTTNRMVKFRTYDKMRAMELLNKMLGFNAPEKVFQAIHDMTPPQEVKIEIVKR